MVKTPQKIVVSRKNTGQVSRIVCLALAGTIFVGYLSYTKLFSKTCALVEGCSYFLGLPTCFYGFALFFILLVLAIVSISTKINFSKGIRFFSVLGILFSGYFSIYELFFASLNIFNGAIYSLLLPSCVYGLVLFIVIWILSGE
jgi:uncharacterized membrane protein